MLWKMYVDSGMEAQKVGICTYKEFERTPLWK